MEPPARSGELILGALADRHQRAVLALLRDRSPPLSEEQIATYLVVQEYEKPPGDVTAREAESFRVQLRHVHLPALEAAGLITWDRQDSTVQPSDDPVLGDASFNEILNTADESLDEALTAYATRRRRHILYLLREEEQAITLSELAEALVTSQDEPGDSPSVKEVAIELHHQHLPPLDDAGLIAYDEAERLVAYEESPILEQLFSLLAGSDPRASTKYEGFFGGLSETAEAVSRTENTMLDLPEPWTDSNNV